MSQRPLKIIRITGFILLQVLLVFLLGEAFCRVAKVPYRESYLPVETALCGFDPVLGWSLKPGMTAVPGSPDRAGDTVATDARGIRVEPGGSGPDSEKPSILFVGGSFTFGYGVPYGDSLPGRFGRLLPPGCQAVNLGVPAFGTDQSLLMLERGLEAFNTKAVVYTFIPPHVVRNGNLDRRRLFPESRVPATKPLFALDDEGGVFLARKPVPIDDYTTSWFWDLLVLRLGPRLGTFPPEPRELTRALVAAMDKEARAKGAEFVVLVWDLDCATRYEAPLPEGVERLVVCDGAPQGFSEMELPGDRHPNARAYAFAAEKLMAYFRDTGLVSACGEPGAEEGK